MNEHNPEEIQNAIFVSARLINEFAASKNIDPLILTAAHILNYMMMCGNLCMSQEEFESSLEEIKKEYKITKLMKMNIEEGIKRGAKE